MVGLFCENSAMYPARYPTSVNLATAYGYSQSQTGQYGQIQDFTSTASDQRAGQFHQLPAVMDPACIQQQMVAAATAAGNGTVPWVYPAPRTSPGVVEDWMGRTVGANTDTSDVSFTNGNTSDANSSGVSSSTSSPMTSSSIMGVPTGTYTSNFRPANYPHPYITHHHAGDYNTLDPNVAGFVHGVMNVNYPGTHANIVQSMVEDSPDISSNNSTGSHSSSCSNSPEQNHLHQSPQLPVPQLTPGDLMPTQVTHTAAPGTRHLRPPFDWMKRQTYQNMPSSGKTRTKDKYRVVYSDHQRLELEKEFHYSRYITIRRKAEIAQTLSLSERQVKIWFQNRRAKERKQNKKQEETILTKVEVQNRLHHGGQLHMMQQHHHQLQQQHHQQQQQHHHHQQQQLSPHPHIVHQAQLQASPIMHHPYPHVHSIPLSHLDIPSPQHHVYTSSPIPHQHQQLLQQQQQQQCSSPIPHQQQLLQQHNQQQTSSPIPQQQLLLQQQQLHSSSLQTDDSRTGSMSMSSVDGTKDSSSQMSSSENPSRLSESPVLSNHGGSPVVIDDVKPEATVI